MVHLQHTPERRTNNHWMVHAYMYMCTWASITLPVTDGAVMATIWLDQLTTLTVTNTTTLVALYDTQVARELT